MKIKTRKKRIKEYNQNYPDRSIGDSVDRLKSYFESRGLDYYKATEKANKKLQTILQNRKYEHIHITLYEYPMKTDRPRSTRDGHVFSPNAKENHIYLERALKSIIKTLKVINTPSEIIIDAYLEMPKQVPPDEIILFESKVLNPIEYPDYDNISKCYTDMLKTTLVVDDDLFYRGVLTKYFSVTPRVEITIRYLSKHESDYVYKKIKNRKCVKALVSEGRCIVERI